MPSRERRSNHQRQKQRESYKEAREYPLNSLAYGCIESHKNPIRKHRRADKLEQNDIEGDHVSVDEAL